MDRQKAELITLSQSKIQNGITSYWITEDPLYIAFYGRYPLTNLG
jgi:hypothetical protein